MDTDPAGRGGLIHGHTAPALCFASGAGSPRAVRDVCAYLTLKPLQRLQGRAGMASSRGLWTIVDDDSRVDRRLSNTACLNGTHSCSQQDPTFWSLLVLAFVFSNHGPGLALIAMAIAVDPVILAAFGEPPEGLDLEERRVVNHNVAVCVSLGLAVAAVALRLYAYRCVSDHTALTEQCLMLMSSQVIYAEGYVYGLAVTATKISILLFYRRLLYSSPSPRSLFSILYWVAFFLATSYPVILWVIMATACRPISFYWNQYAGAEGQCINIKSFLLALGIINMLNDIMILTVPIPRILELQLSKKLKASTIGIMLLGGL
ncbi:integral membrane protein pth11-like protein [Ilyonectria robusta]